MANYTKITDFAAKDSLLSGNPLKLIKGSEHDDEYNAIATAIATKPDMTGSATNWSGTSGGTANAITLTPSTSIAAYTTGAQFNFKAGTTNTSTATCAISGLAAKTIQKGGAALAGGEITAGKWYSLLYDGTYLQLGEISKERVSINVKDFGAVGDGVTDDTAEIQAAIDHIESIGGGAIYFPAGNYIVSKDTLLHDAADISFTIHGDGPKASVITCSDATVGFIIKCNVASSNTASITIRDIGINGPGGASPAGIGLYLQGSQFQTRVENVYFNGLSVGMQLEGVYNSTFHGLHFRNYITGIQGDSGTTAQNNTFISCYFGDGKNVSPAVGVPVKSTGMAYNTYMNCNFESRGLIKQVDMRGGSGSDVMINCRFEQLNAGTSGSWLIPGNYQKYINCTFHQSGTYSVSNISSSYYLIDIGETNYGKGNTFENLVIMNSNYVDHYVRLNAGAVGNRIEFGRMGDANYTTTYNIVTDLSAGDNEIVWPNGAVEKYCVDGTFTTYGGGPVKNLLTATVDMNTGWTYSGTTRADATDVGPYGIGQVVDVTKTGGLYRVLSPGFTATSGKAYIFSCWVKAKGAGNVFEATMANSGPTYFSFTLTDTQWRRVSFILKCTSTTTWYAFMRQNDTGFYIFGPQVEEFTTTDLRVGPGGYVAVGASASGYVYPTPNTKMNFPVVAVPAYGDHSRGAQAVMLDVSNGGSPGWICTAAGAPGTWKAIATIAA